MGPDLIPNSVCREKRGIVMQGSVPWVPLHCANCGKADGGMVTQETLDALGNYAFYLCDPCSEKCGDIPGHHKIPMEVYWAKVAEAMLEKEGRILTEDEIKERLADPNSYLSKLEKDVPKL